MTTKKRSIFVDVGPGEDAPVAPAPVRRREPERRAIAAWLSMLFALVVAMIAVGGMTRLMDSGLSITEWRPVTGAVPPLDAAAWDAEFAKYRETPQYALATADMTLSEFKRIYWWEWAHRQLGRVIGMVWALGFLWFAARRRTPAGWTPRLLGVGALGGLQGAIGWWMVTSGLTGTMTSVASYRLAVHLGIAFLILGLLAWFVMRLRREEADLLQARRQRRGLGALSAALVVVAFFQIVLGALVAGIDAGRHYPEWPTMAGAFVPPGAFELQPLWRNFTENAGLVQFNHRMVGYLLALLVVFAWIRSRRSANDYVKRAFDVVLAFLVVQIALGIVTVLYSAPWQIAIVHQIGAVALFVAILRARFVALYPPMQRVRRR